MNSHGNIVFLTLGTSDNGIDVWNRCGAYTNDLMRAVEIDIKVQTSPVQALGTARKRVRVRLSYAPTSRLTSSDSARQVLRLVPFSSKTRNCVESITGTRVPSSAAMKRNTSCSISPYINLNPLTPPIDSERATMTRYVALSSLYPVSDRNGSRRKASTFVLPSILAM